jgi:serine/threonine protein kinase
LLLENKPHPGSKDVQIKVIDFGTSTIICDDQMLQNMCGTSYYLAPEVIAGKYNEK